MFDTMTTAMPILFSSSSTLTRLSSHDPDPSRVHRISLSRTSESSPLGLTIRGGFEYGLGHFVSEVEVGSEAHLQGIRPGDQILRCNGISLSGATHREAVKLISSADQQLTLDVVSTGVVPVRASRGAVISFQPIDSIHDDVIPLTQRPSQELMDSRVIINLNGNQGLGCSICEGPSSSPGIFVQSTKPGGLAREAGLRPGDQIVDCNGINFQSIDFNDAVYLLKSNRHLDMVIRKGTGLNLFPSESSGYESSSSSNTGDHNVVGLPPPRAENMNHVNESRMKLEGKLIEQERKKLEEEQEWLKRETLRLEAEKKRFEEEKKKVALTSHHEVQEEVSNKANVGGLASAIQVELQRRAEARREGSSVNPSPTNSTATMATVSDTPKKYHNLATLKNDKHEALMKEFKLAHKKMFNLQDQSEEEEEEDEGSNPSTDIAPDAPPPKASSPNQAAEIRKPLVKPPLPPPTLSSAKVDAVQTKPTEIPSSVTTKSDATPTITNDVEEPPKPSTPVPDYDDDHHHSHSPMKTSGSDTSDETEEEDHHHSQSHIRPIFSEETLNTLNRKSKYNHHFSYMVPAKSVPDLDLLSSSSSSMINKTFARRHPHLEVTSLESFNPDSPGTTSLSGRHRPQPPPFYFDRHSDTYSDDSNVTTFDFLPQPSTVGKNVRFKLGEQGTLAAKDYRRMTNSNKGLMTSEVVDNVTMAAPKTKGAKVTIQSMSRPNRSISPRKRDKGPAPPPPPPPPATTGMATTKF